MKKVVRATIKAGCALLFLAAAVSPQALADCPEPSTFFGNLSGGGAIGIPVDQRTGEFGVFSFIYESPAINTGTVSPAVWAFDAGPAGGIEGTTVVFADWAGNLGFIGCPYSLEVVTRNSNLSDENIHQVFVGSDSGGVVIIVAKAGVNPGFLRDIDFDSAAGPEGFVKSTLKPQLANATRSGTTITLDMMWDAPSVNVDTGSTAVTALVGRYGIVLRRSGGASQELQDLDTIPTDTRARVSFEMDAAGSGSTGILFVRADLVGLGGAPSLSVMGAASTSISLDPLLADPRQPRGRGKGLEKAPGLNR